MTKGKLIITLLGLGLLGLIFFRPKADLGRQNLPLEETKTLPQKVDSQGEVSVGILPKNVPDSEIWEFEVTLDTHSLELSEDLPKLTRLWVEEKEYAPLSWEGDPPGDHHREGILKFNKISPSPKEIKLKMTDVGRISERLFSWEF